MDKHSVVHPDSGTLFSLIKREMLTPATTWMDFEDVLLCEISQTQKDKYCVILIIGGPRRS